MADAKYQRQAGSGEQLAYGEATDLDQQQVLGNDIEAQLADSAIDAGQIPEAEVEYADDEEEDYVPAGEDEEILFGDPEGVSKPLYRGTKPIPKSVVRQLPMLALLANDPTTPPALRAAYKLIISRLAEEVQ